MRQESILFIKRLIEARGSKLVYRSLIIFFSELLAKHHPGQLQLYGKAAPQLSFGVELLHGGVESCDTRPEKTGL